MKKLIVLLLVMSMLFSIVACGEEAVGTSAPRDTTNSFIETTQPPDTENPLVDTTSKPTETTVKPAETTQPTETTVKPAETTKPTETTVKPAETTKPTETSITPLETSQPTIVTTQKIPTVVVPSTNQSIEGYPEQLKEIYPYLEDDKVQFWYVEGSQGSYTADSLWVDTDAENDLDAVDLMTLVRNYRIYEDLGITIEAITDPDLSISGLQAFTKILFDIQSPDIDVYCGYQAFDISAALNGYFVNLNTIVNENGEAIIDIEKPYWATNYINSITYNDQMYWVTGDLALRYTGGLYCTFVNLDLYDTYVKANYEGKSIYDIVNEKKWTMQTMLDMADLVDADLDNNGVASEGDRLGIVFEPNDILDGIAFGCKINFSSKTTADGKDTIQIALHQDKRAVKLAGYFSQMWASTYAYQAPSWDSQKMMPLFAGGNTLFAVNKLYQAEIYLSEMQNFAIIPTPLLDEDQKEYGSGVHDGVTIFGISKFSDCPIAAAATLELMSYYGNLLVTPTYVNSVLKGSETVRNPESIAMIDLIRAGCDTDFAAAWGTEISNIGHIYRVKINCDQFSPYVKINSRNWPSRLSTLLADLEAIAIETE